MKTERFLEFVGANGGRTLQVDSSAGIVRGVKIVGLSSKNGRSYPASTLRAARALYEGAKVNVNHPRDNPGAPRDYGDRFGSIKNVVMKGDGLYGDLHYNPAHRLARQFEWDAKNNPSNLGFSHNIEGRISYDGGKTVVEEIAKVHAVDLVADPATTNGLFESLGDMTPDGYDAAAGSGASVLNKQAQDAINEVILKISNDWRLTPQQKADAALEVWTKGAEFSSATDYSGDASGSSEPATESYYAGSQPLSTSIYESAF